MNDDANGRLEAGGSESDGARVELGRRTFFQVLGVAGAAASGLVPMRASAAETGPGASAASDPPAVLVDTTRCLGCRACEASCAEANGLPAPNLDEDAYAKGPRETSDLQRTVVNRFQTAKGEVYAKKQCMHCLQPACASACLSKAMLKSDEGPVIWRGRKCMGCRFCMVSCPFDVPKFEYHSANPKIQKCTLCFDRVKAGGKPACVENCPGEALTFGRRSELLLEARARIAGDGEKYHPEVYGEHEAGGTSWLYLSAVPFEQIGLPTTLGATAYPELTKPFLYTVPLVLTLGPALLLGLSQATKPEPAEAQEEESHGEQRHPGRDAA